MFNNIHLVAFAISSQGHLVKFDAILMLLIGSHLNLQRPTSANQIIMFTYKNALEFFFKVIKK